MEEETRIQTRRAYVWALLRITIACILLWAFADKFFGLGFSTCRGIDTTTMQEQVKIMCDEAAVQGGSPTSGFLEHAVKGPLQGLYDGLAGSQLADVMFMTGLLLIGLSLLSGIGVTIAVYSGVALFIMMWAAVLPGENNPILDEHIVYSFVLIGILLENHHQKWGFGLWWQKQKIVQRFRFLA